jgi:PKD repeat protein
MKLNLYKKYFGRAILIYLILLIGTNISIASNDFNEVIVSGQITNYEYGNPIEGHPVYIKSDSTWHGLNDYSNTVYTDVEGYYYDTIATEESRGSLIIFTHDQFDKKVDTTVYFRFLDRTNSRVIADFGIYFPYQAKELQARFKYLQKSNNNKNKFKFIDETENENIISQKWVFGDGYTSNESDPTHEYYSYGLFKVSLTVTAVVDNEIIISTITKQLYLRTRDYYHMGGHVFSEYFPIDKGLAFLYMFDTANHAIAIDTMAFDTLGYYYFYQVPEGTYLIKAEPMKESEYYGVLLPTYFGNELFWEDAKEVELEGTSWEYNIKLGHADHSYDGTGGIGGNIKYLSPIGRNPYYYYARGVNIFLFDDSGDLLTYRYTNNSGDFAFDDIEVNPYSIYPEITGISANKIRIELTSESPVIDDIEINIFASSISSDINENGSHNDLVGLPYPNPASNSLTIPVSSISGKEVSYEVFDIFGRKLISQRVNNSSNSDVINVPIHSLDNGTFCIRTKIDNLTFDRLFIVAK